MKITVGIPSRSRPLELAASVLALDKTKSGAHEVQYIIATDYDDTPTAKVALQLFTMKLPIGLSSDFRPLGLGQIHNRLLSATDPEAVFMLWSDRLVPVNIGWDDAIAGAVVQFPTNVLWMDSVHLAGAGQFIIPPAWRAALPDGKVCPGTYPAWFEDTAVEEETLLVHGGPRLACWAKAAGPRTARTNRLWDLAFWISGFAKTRPLRIERAKKIARSLGLPFSDRSKEIECFEKRDAEFLSRADALTEQYGALGEPDETYFSAKRQMEAILAGLGPADKEIG